MIKRIIASATLSLLMASCANSQDYRPTQIHFSPEKGWMNDPNGMVYFNGEYHLFYQHNPDTTVWAPMHWGHAVSRDLVSWQHLPIALFPDSAGMIFSGSCVIDVNNTSGFGKNAMVAIYTAASQTQAQAIAYSLDNGRTFTKYNGGLPVLTSDKPDFRDPNVFWFADQQKWVMSVAAGQEIEFYSSTNLKEWTRTGSFGYGYGNHHGVWECPDMFILDGKWVLIVNINPGGIWGGSASQYFVGNFDGQTFISDDPIGSQKWMDYGKDHYATVSWHDAPDNRRIAITWLSNWEYATLVPATDFRSTMSIPVELSLKKISDADYRLISLPAKEIDNLKVKANKLADVNKGAYEIDVELNPASDTKTASFSLRNNANEEVVFTYDLVNKTFAMDRVRSGQVDFAPSFKAVTLAPISNTGKQSLRIIVDRQSIEIFDTDGQFCMTNMVFPTRPYSEFTFDKGVVNYSIYKLK